MRIEQHETTFRKYVLNAQNDYDASGNRLVDARQILLNQEKLYMQMDDLINSSDLNVETLREFFGKELDKFKLLKSEMVTLKESTSNLQNENKRLGEALNKYVEKTDSDQSRIKNLVDESEQLRDLTSNIQRFYQDVSEYVCKMKKMYLDCKIQFDTIEAETAEGKKLHEEYQKLLEKYQESEDLKTKIQELEKIVSILPQTRS